ncbi:pilus assembly protein TadG [Bradyrhizobium sp. LTSPM299]|uniref:TadE/TadG family type IV pilus assembly protein n=1 Tax=Bradyrhizobium sp. LTSPM299 TaxID=1619233 RepID=UPI0005CA9E31|nr:TadE/TadG family type IV pilus assembly protein [Bradyrhizobium sp. LTSPM299]KJC60650.1 pilus assembly protein TadG [Bradyrhizobium sp. LTSPM299]
MRQRVRIWLRLRRFARDRRGLAAVEFALILPLMLLLFFGTVEFSSGVAVDRKVTLMARTLSDLTSQSISVADSDLTNFFSAAVGIMTPYDPSPTQATLSEIYVDSTNTAKIQWTKAATIASGATQATLTPSSHTVGQNVTSIVPPALLIPQTSLIYSEISYKYVPTVGWVMAKAGITLSDVAYTRPRQANCVIYPTPASGSPMPACPST